MARTCTSVCLSQLDMKRSSSNINGAREESENSCCGPTDAIRTCQNAMERQNGWRRLIHPLRSDTSQESSETLQSALAVQSTPLMKASLKSLWWTIEAELSAQDLQDLQQSLRSGNAPGIDLTKPSGPWWVKMFCLPKRLSAPLNIEREVRQCGSMSPATFGPH